MSRFAITEDLALERQLTPFGLGVLRFLRRAWRRLVPAKNVSRDNPDEGSEPAGVTARLRPPPPVLPAGAAKELPGAEEERA
jgi:hypothetical protein